MQNLYKYHFLFFVFCTKCFSTAFVVVKLQQRRTTTDAYFFFRNHRNEICRLAASSQLPTIEQLSNDPFMKQVQYGAELTNELLEKDSTSSNSDNLRELLQAQLSHSDGIRGFMVSYLTIDNDDSQDDDDDSKTAIVPQLLVDTLQEQVKSNPDDLIPLAFMNVIMPTAMSTMHQEEDLRQSSARTAERGLCILKTLIGQHSLVRDNAQAIINVATAAAATSSSSGGGGERGEQISPLIEYWSDFFDKWGYGEVQKRDIGNVMNVFLGKE